MSENRKLRMAAAFAAFALVVAACGGATVEESGDVAAVEAATTTVGATDATTEHMDDEAEHSEDEAAHLDEYLFGEPGDASEADRVIEIEAKDDFTFSPAEVSVTADETITFVLTNTGNLPHDFTPGDEATQDAHDAEMAEMAADEMAGHDEANAVVLAAGETKELTWHFTESGSFLMGCHQAGHYAAGMRGTVTVDA